MKTLLNCSKKLFLFFCLGFACATGSAQNVCQMEAGRADMAIREQYQQSIDYFLRLSAAARLKGIDPRNFPQLGPDGQIEILDLIQIATDLSNQRDQGIQAIFSGYQECVAQLAPYQNIVNIAVFYLTTGISQVIPGKAMYIDASNLLAGTPFGGPNALVPQLREQIFSMLGIGGAAADFIRNPLQITQNGPLRMAWNPILGGMGGGPIGILPQLPPLLNGLPSLPPIQSPNPIVIGNVGGQRICLPWC